MCARLISVPFEADLLLFRDFSGRIQLDSNPFFREKRDAGWRGGVGGIDCQIYSPYVSEKECTPKHIEIVRKCTYCLSCVSLPRKQMEGN